MNFRDFSQFCYFSEFPRIHDKNDLPKPQSGKVTQVHDPLPKDVISTKTTQNGKMTQVPMFTSKGCDIARGDARRVDTQKIL